MDGTNDHVLVSDQDEFSFTDNTSDKPFSITAWVYVDNVAADNGPVAAKVNFDGVGGGTIKSEWLFKQENGEVCLFLYDNNGSLSGDSIRVRSNAAVVTDNTWHHIAATYDGSGAHAGMKVYADGALLASTNDATNSGGGHGLGYVCMRNSTIAVALGATLDGAAGAGGGNRIFEDFLADTCIFNKELSSSEIQEVYNSGKVKDMTTASTYSDLVSWWKMGDDRDHSEAGGIIDYVNGFNGTLANGAYIAASPELGTDLVKISDHHIYTSHGRTRQIKNAAGAFGTAISTPTAAPTLATDGYATENQRFAHIVVNTFPIDTDNNSSFIVYGYNHAFGKWAVLRRHASGFKNIYENGAPNDYILQHSQNTRPCTRYVLEIAGMDRIYIRKNTGAATDQVFLGFNTF